MSSTRPLIELEPSLEELGVHPSDTGKRLAKLYHWCVTVGFREESAQFTVNAERGWIACRFPYSVMEDFAEMFVGCRKHEWMRHEAHLLPALAETLLLKPAQKAGHEVELVSSERLIAERNVVAYICPAPIKPQVRTLHMMKQRGGEARTNPFHIDFNLSEPDTRNWTT